MRKLFLVITTLLLGCVANAQRSSFQQEVAFGINGGMNFAEVSFLHNDKNSNSRYLGSLSMKEGVRFGVTGRYIAQKHFGVQMEVNYVQAGWQEKFRDETLLNNDVDVKGLKLSRELDYIEVPLLAHIYFGNKFRYYFNVGPKLMFLTSMKELKSNLTYDETLSEIFRVNGMDDPRIEEDPYCRKVDYGITGGVGFEYPIWKTRVTIEGRYSYGFEDLFRNTKKELYQRSNNQMASVTMSVLIPAIHFNR